MLSQQGCGRGVLFDQCSGQPTSQPNGFGVVERLHTGPKVEHVLLRARGCSLLLFVFLAVVAVFTAAICVALRFCHAAGRAQRFRFGLIRIQSSRFSVCRELIQLSSECECDHSGCMLRGRGMGMVFSVLYLNCVVVSAFMSPATSSLLECSYVTGRLFSCISPPNAFWPRNFTIKVGSFFFDL